MKTVRTRKPKPHFLTNVILQITALLREDFTILLPPVPEKISQPREMILFAFRNICCFLKDRSDPLRTLTRDSHPHVFGLLTEFKPSRNDEIAHPQLMATPKGRERLKILQIAACDCLASWEWLDEGNAPRAAKLLQSALEIYESHPPFKTEAPVYTYAYVREELVEKCIRPHLDQIIANDVALNSALNGIHTSRKDAVDPSRTIGRCTQIPSCYSHS